jgi:hypothetical protein
MIVTIDEHVSNIRSLEIGLYLLTNYESALGETIEQLEHLWITHINIH